MELETTNTTAQEHQRAFNDYLSTNPPTDHLKYTLDLDAFRIHHPLTAQDVIKHPQKYYKLTRNVLEKQAHQLQTYASLSKKLHYQIAFQGNLGSNFVTPRGLGSKFSNQLVGIHGIITKMDITKFYLEKSVHYCQKTEGYQVKDYPDNYAVQKDFQVGKTRFIKTVDDHGNPLDFQYGLSSFRDIQKVVIQQLPQNAPPGLLPMSVEVILQGSLVGKVKPGDRVQMIGIYRIVPGAYTKEKGIFRPIFICLSVKPLYKLALTKNPIPQTNNIPKEQIFSLFSRSIAPSLSGHQYVKKAVLLMLLGGCEKNLQNGTHLRGDINILMVGDPGTGKSQILRWVLSTVDLGIGTTGSGASGVGLTAAVVSDKQTGEKGLQAGAMVLADRGFVCIDQFDKMNETDRVAVHEVMQQQTVTIAKAGIHCSLNARCSVIAAANPIYGQYQDDLPPTKNINMPDSLLSRFDLIFIIRDDKNTEKDAKISQRVARNHRLAPSISQVFNQYQEDDDFIIQPMQTHRNQDSLYQKSNVFKSDARTQILTQDYLKKYINNCKKNYTPILTQDSVVILAHMWQLLRQKDFNSQNKAKVLPITIRTHQTLIRLSTAHAKLRMSSTVQPSDCIQAFKLIVYTLDGMQDALDSQLTEICKSNNINSDGKLKSEVDKKSIKKTQKQTSVAQTKIQKQKKEKKEKDEDSVKKIEKQVEKMQISKKQTKKVDAVIKRAGGITKQSSQDNTLKKLVFRKMAELKSRKRGGSLIYEQLYKLVSQEMDKDQFNKILQVLEVQGSLMFDKKSNNKNDWKIYPL